MSHRPAFSTLPELVRDWTADVLGAPVVQADSQPDGYSPASADRVRAANGARAFVKVVHESWNPRTRDMHRTEARVAAHLPSGFPAPALLGLLDEDGWVALAFEDLDAAHPGLPWSGPDVARVCATLQLAARLGTPAPVPDLPLLQEVLRDDFGGFARVRDEPFADVDPFVMSRLGELVESAERGLAALAGETLTHVDVRADNLLFGRDGRTWVIDWPWASRGAAWFDAVSFLASTVSPVDRGAASVPAVSAAIDEVLARHGVDPAVGTDVVGGIASFFIDAVRRQPGPGLAAHLVAHRRRTRDRLLPLLRHRWGH